MSNVDNPTFQHKVEFANSNQLQQVLDSGNFDGIGVIFDYMIFEDRHFLRLTNSILDIQEKIANDSTIKAIVQRTNNPSHFMVSIRKRDIALDSLLPIIEYSPTADEIEISREKLMNAAQKMFNTTEMVDDRLAEVGAKILGATSVVNDYVLLAESMIFDHRFTPPPPAMPDFLK